MLLQFFLPIFSSLFKMQEQLKHIWSTHGYYVGYQGKQVDFDIQLLLASGSLLIFAWSSKIKDIGVFIC